MCFVAGTVFLFLLSCFSYFRVFVIQFWVDLARQRRSKIDGLDQPSLYGHYARLADPGAVLDPGRAHSVVIFSTGHEGRRLEVARAAHRARACSFHPENGMIGQTSDQRGGRRSLY